MKTTSDLANGLRIIDIIRPDSNFRQIDEVHTIGPPPKKYQ